MRIRRISRILWPTPFLIRYFFSPLLAAPCSAAALALQLAFQFQLPANCGRPSTVHKILLIRKIRMNPWFRLPLLLLPKLALGQAPTPLRPTYCNPLNLDYGYTPFPEFSTAGRHRATADPVITLFEDKYYLFSTNQKGYWWSDDLASWHFLARSFLKPENTVFDDLRAPAVVAPHGTLLVIGSSHQPNFALWMSTNPQAAWAVSKAK